MSHITPALWCALHLTHAENHITRAVIRQPSTAISATLALISMAQPIPLQFGWCWTLLKRNAWRSHFKTFVSHPVEKKNHKPVKMKLQRHAWILMQCIGIVRPLWWRNGYIFSCLVSGITACVSISKSLRSKVVSDLQIGVRGRLRERPISSKHAHFEIFRPPNLKRVLRAENSFS